MGTKKDSPTFGESNYHRVGEPTEGRLEGHVLGPVELFISRPY